MGERGERASNCELKAICGGAGAAEAEGPGMEGKKQHRGGGMFKGGLWVLLSLGGGFLSCNTG